MEETIELMLELLRSSLNRRQPNLPPLTEKQWEDVYWLSRKHGVVTMINDVIEAMPDELRPHSDIALSWALSAERTRYHYARQEAVLDKIRTKASEQGLQMVLLKGMTLSKLFPVPSSRACGDIDIYFPGNYEKGNELLGMPNAEMIGKHSETAIDGVTVENHLNFLDLGYQSQRLAEQYITDSLGQVSSDGELPPMANMVYLLMHTVSHLTAKIKLPLRNVVDWGLFLHSYRDQLPPEECHKVLKSIHMDDAFNILTYLASEFIGQDLSGFVRGKVRKNDAQKLRSMILNKSYMETRPEESNMFKYFALRYNRNRQRRWLYRYLPANHQERLHDLIWQLKGLIRK